MSSQNNRRSEDVFSFGPGFTSEMEDAPEDRTNVPPTSGDEFAENCRRIFGDAVDQQLEAMVHFRKILSVDDRPPIDDVIEAGLIPRFVEFLKDDNHRELQYQAAWALTNVASGNAKHTAVVVKHGCIPIFTRLLRSGEEQMIEQSAWAIGNIAGESHTSRNKCLRDGAMEGLIEAVSRCSAVSTLRNITWSISNLCRGSPAPPIESVSPAIPVLARILNGTSDESTNADGCWALSNIAEGSDEAIDMILMTGIASHLVPLLKPSTAPKMLAPLLRLFGIILSGNEAQTQHMVDVGIIPALGSMLTVQRKVFRREACWALSNITAGNSRQVQAVFDATPPVFPKIVELLHTDIRKEALWVVTNVFESGSWENILRLGPQVLQPLCDLLSVGEPAIVVAALTGIYNLLKRASENGQVDQFVDILSDLNAVEVIENLQSHSNTKVYEQALKILQEFFVGDE